MLASRHYIMVLVMLPAKSHGAPGDSQNSSSKIYHWSEENMKNFSGFPPALLLKENQKIPFFIVNLIVAFCVGLAGLVLVCQ